MQEPTDYYATLEEKKIRDRLEECCLQWEKPRKAAAPQ